MINMEALIIEAHHHFVLRSTVKQWLLWTDVRARVLHQTEGDEERTEQIIGRLRHVVLTGETSGQFAVGDPDALPWLDDLTTNNPADEHMASLFGEVPA